MSDLTVNIEKIQYKDI